MSELSILLTLIIYIISGRIFNIYLINDKNYPLLIKIFINYTIINTITIVIGTILSNFNMIKIDIIFIINLLLLILSVISSLKKSSLKWEKIKIRVTYFDIIICVVFFYTLMLYIILEADVLSYSYDRNIHFMRTLYILFKHTTPTTHWGRLEKSFYFNGYYIAAAFFIGFSNGISNLLKEHRLIIDSIPFLELSYTFKVFNALNTAFLSTVFIYSSINLIKIFFDKDKINKKIMLLICILIANIYINRWIISEPIVEQYGLMLALLIIIIMKNKIESHNIKDILFTILLLSSLNIHILITLWILIILMFYTFSRKYLDLIYIFVIIFILILFIEILDKGIFSGIIEHFFRKISFNTMLIVKSEKSSILKGNFLQNILSKVIMSLIKIIPFYEYILIFPCIIYFYYKYKNKLLKDKLVQSIIFSSLLIFLILLPFPALISRIGHIFPLICTIIYSIVLINIYCYYNKNRLISLFLLFIIFLFVIERVGNTYLHYQLRWKSNITPSLFRVTISLITYIIKKTNNYSGHVVYPYPEIPGYITMILSEKNVLFANPAPDLPSSLNLSILYSEIRTWKGIYRGSLKASLSNIVNIIKKYNISCIISYKPLSNINKKIYQNIFNINIEKIEKFTILCIKNN